MCRILIVLGFIIICALFVDFAVAVPTPFPYQAHSFNDLNITRQLLRKGVKYFKFDASLANKQSCLGFSTWDGHNDCIQTNQYAEEVCCLAMRGDASSAPDFHYPFNTSSEFIDLIGSFLAENEPKIDILFIAIDFQFGFSFSNSLAEHFMAELATLMNTYSKLHVTTKGDYILQYDHVCRYASEAAVSQVMQEPARSLIFSETQGCTPQRSHISKSRFFLQSPAMTINDPRDFKGRYQNFNIIYTEIDRLCSSGFPNWINRNPLFPLIFWEPSNEQQIQSSLRKLMAPQCQRRHNRSLYGIALASNIDPEMFEIAMKTTNTAPLQQQFPWQFRSRRLWLENATSVKMAKVLSQGRQNLVLYRKVEAFNYTQHFLTLLAHSPTADSVFIEREVEIHEEAVELRGLKDKVILVASKNSSIVHRKAFDAVLIAYNMQLQPTALLPVANFLTSFADQDAFYFLALSSNPQMFITYRTQESLSTPIQYKLPVFLPEAQMSTIRSMLLLTASGSKQEVFLLFGDSEDKSWIVRVKNSDEHSIKTISFGTKTKLTQRGLGQFRVFFENSYSHGGLLINNNGQNKCLYHRSQTLSNLATIPYLIDGMRATIADLLDFTEDDEQEVKISLSKAVTACHPKLPLSKYLNGIDLEPLYIWDQIFLASRRLPISQLGLITTLFSGASGFEQALRNRKGFTIASVDWNSPLAALQPTTAYS